MCYLPEGGDEKGGGIEYVLFLRNQIGRGMPARPGGGMKEMGKKQQYGKGINLTEFNGKNCMKMGKGLL